MLLCTVYLIGRYNHCLILFFREQKIAKPKILAELISQGYKVQEVNFFTMLSIVQSCQELQGERINHVVKEVNNYKPPKKSKRTNYMTIFKGIVPGEISLEHIDPVTFQYLIKSIIT